MRFESLGRPWVVDSRLQQRVEFMEQECSPRGHYEGDFTMQTQSGGAKRYLRAKSTHGQRKPDSRSTPWCAYFTRWILTSSMLTYSMLACWMVNVWGHSALYAEQIIAEAADSIDSSPTPDVAHSSAKNPSAQKSSNENSSPRRLARPGWYLGRQIAPTMSASGAEWLTRKSRESEEDPRKLLQALQLLPTQKVCDFGCGNGYYTIQLARRVGPRGKVFAVDIQEEMLTLLTQRSQPRGLNNIEPILATLTDPKLPHRQLDLVLMVDVYHELSEPELILQSIYASLNETGRVAIVEFREEDPDVPILPLHKMSQAQVMKEIRANGFKLVGQFDNLPWQHVLFFARQDSKLEAQPLKPWQADESISSTPGRLPSESHRPESE